MAVLLNMLALILILCYNILYMKKIEKNKQFIALPKIEGQYHCGMCKQYKPLSEFSEYIKFVKKQGSRCKSCQKKHGKKWREINKEKLKKYFSSEEVKEKNKEAVLRYRLKSYGISLEQYEEMKIRQGEKCLICNIHVSNLKTGLCIDHCHNTKKIRGLLCRKCNSALGLFNENLEFLKNAINYLELTSVP